MNTGHVTSEKNITKIGQNGPVLSSFLYTFIISIIYYQVAFHEVVHFALHGSNWPKKLHDGPLGMDYL